MAEDGMLINFDVGNGPLVSNPRFRGGSWKDKLSAKKSAQYNRNKALQKASPIVNGDQQPSEQVPKEAEDFPEHRPSKKRRTSDEGIEQHRRPSGDRPRPVNGRRPLGQNQQVVSSLFSFNPTSDAPKEAPSADTEPAVPSNAPLAGELETFTSLGLSAHLAEHLLRKMEIKAPTAIQRAAVTQLLKEDSDVFIQSETGSGKTLAYLLPIVQKLIALSSDRSVSEGGIHRDSGLYAIVLAPTRELSKQISAVLERLLKCAVHIVSGIVMGGEKKQKEKARLRKGLNILIATPGRLADHLEHTEVLDVSKVRWLVLDEGDRLMELGFGEDIKRILSKLDRRAKPMSQVPGLPRKRVTVLCSATMKSNVQQLGELSLKDAVHVQGHDDRDEQDGAKAAGGESEDKFSAPAQLQQSYAIVPAKLRLVSLVALLKQTFVRKGVVQKAIVFLSCADSVDFHFDLLAREASIDTTNPPTTSNTTTITTTDPPPNEPRTTAHSPTLSTSTNTIHIHRLHGSLPQTIRTTTLANYRKSPHPSILFSTDVASRGLDLPNVDYILEYDPPFSAADHLHRVGRTARAGAAGRAAIFLLPGPEEGYVTILDSIRARTAHTPRQLHTTDLLRKGFGSPGLGAGNDWQTRATEWQLEIERWALESPRVLEMARRAFQSHVRAYATHVAAERGMFDMQALHLGHLAKAFALRDRPGKVGVPGLRPKAGGARVEKGRAVAAGLKGGRKGREGGVNGDAAGEIRDDGDLGAGKRKMRAKMKEQAAVSEFNLG